MIQFALPTSSLYWVELTSDGLPILWFKDRNVEVASVVKAYLQGSTFAELCTQFWSLTPEMIQQTLTYYHHHQTLFDEYLAEEARVMEAYARRSPLAEQIAKGKTVTARLEAYKKAHGLR